MKKASILSTIVATLGIAAITTPMQAGDTPAMPTTPSAPVTAAAAPAPANDIDFTVKTLVGKDVALATQYKDKVLLLVNVASKCGHTPQYKGLQALHEEYKGKGLCILGFPCNQFGGQEPGSAEEIQTFCTTKYAVTFDLFEKVNVKGKDACPLYKHLSAATTTPKGAGDVGWNFEKFLIGKDGKVAARFASGVKPDNPDLLKAIQQELAK